MSSPVSADPALFKEAMELDRQDFIEESIGAWQKFLQTQMKIHFKMVVIFLREIAGGVPRFHKFPVIV